MATFHGTYLAKDIALSDDGKPLLRMHLVSLSGMNQSEVSALSAATNFAKVMPPKQVDLSTGVMTGNKIGGRNPMYPERAEAEPYSGQGGYAGPHWH